MGSEGLSNGKPSGVIPGPIGFHTDMLGSNQATTWRRGSPKTNAYENPTYSQHIIDLFARMYYITGDEKWLKPRAVAISRDGKEVLLEGGATIDGLRHTPVLIFSAQKDRRIPIEKMRKLKDKLKQVGGKVKMVETPSGHGGYRNLEVYQILFDWFDAHRRQPKEKAGQERK